MRGSPWTAQEWLSEVVFAVVHRAGGWTAVVALTAASFAATFVLLTRALLRKLDPLRAVLFVSLAVMMAIDHLLARPFVLAMPVMIAWMIGLVDAVDEDRSPSLWMLPLMALWANLHGGFTLGVAVAAGFAADGVFSAAPEKRMAMVREWGLFICLAVLAALLTPHGVHGFLFTWQVLTQDTYALERITEWRSPNFHVFQGLEVWLLGGLALLLHQGLRLPPVRIVLLLGFLHLALKHGRNVELLGMVSPLLVAKPFASQWAKLRPAARQDSAKSLFQELARPAGYAASFCTLVALAGACVALAHFHPVRLPEFTVPARPLAAAREARLVDGPVLNDYGYGGYLILSGIPPAIDGRTDMYRDDFIRRYFEAVELTRSGALDEMLDRYRITWTLLRPGTPALTALDRMPGWQRVYEDDKAVIHARKGTP